MAPEGCVVSERVYAGALKSVTWQLLTVFSPLLQIRDQLYVPMLRGITGNR